MFAHGRPERVASALERLQALAAEAGVELVGDDDSSADVAIVLGGDGTMLRALTTFLGTGVPVFGVNFGRVGFLTAVANDELRPACGARSRVTSRWSSSRRSTSR